jgi:hypothetical protein
MTVPARSNPTPSRSRHVLLLAVVLLAAACTSGGREQADQPPATPAPAGPLRVDLVTTAKVPKGGDARRAARRAAPDLERFLHRYLTVAFVGAAGGKARWNGLLKLFDPPVKAAARKQLDALSLGAAARQVSAVRPERATARAVVLYDRRPVAATVRLAFDGTADTAKGSGPVHLRSTLQLLSTRAGWRIAAFDSRTGSAR